MYIYNSVASCVNKTAYLLYAAMGQGHHDAAPPRRDTLMMMGVKLMRRGDGKKCHRYQERKFKISLRVQRKKINKSRNLLQSI